MYKSVVIFFLSSVVISSNVFAYCKVEDAIITQVGQYHDGHIFVNFDKQTNCPCSIKHRMALHKDHEKFMSSMVLTAFTTGKKVRAEGEEACSVHGNTAKLVIFDVYK